MVTMFRNPFKRNKHTGRVCLSHLEFDRVSVLVKAGRRVKIVVMIDEEHNNVLAREVELWMLDATVLERDYVLFPLTMRWKRRYLQEKLSKSA